MRHASIKVANKCLITTLLLILGVVSSHAHYYINIRQTNGNRLRYAVSAIDSVWFDYDEPQEPTGNYEYVDLGLSVKWASFNVGATAPEECGDYFAWGETETKMNYNEGNYKYSNGSLTTLTKYCTSMEYGKDGFTDGMTTLLPEDDVAHVIWGGGWRMPTLAEYKELIDKCSWTWTTQNGVNGYLITRSGYEGRSIFLPAAGFFTKDNDHAINVGSGGRYWTNSINEMNQCDANRLGFNSSEFCTFNDWRFMGFTVRPVCQSTRAQYYMNIRQTDGNRLRYVVSAIDSVWFDNDGAQVAGIYEYVDLGLSVKWASFNVGATAPEDYGDYYAWGETNVKTDYSWSTYKYCNGSENTLTKYCSKSKYGNEGFTDGITTLLPEDDVANVKWSDDWRMPTQSEIDELCSGANCTWEWTIQNGVNGYLVTSKKSGYEGASIFLPAAGARYETDFVDVGSSGYYWFSLLRADIQNCAWMIDFSSRSRFTNWGDGRCYGHSVRPVCP